MPRATKIIMSHISNSGDTTLNSQNIASHFSGASFYAERAIDCSRFTRLVEPSAFGMGSHHNFNENKKAPGWRLLVYAERGGFEPPVPVRIQHLSRVPPSATRSPLQFKFRFSL